MKEKNVNSRPSDEGISTKKGFLITLPGSKKSKKASGESMIMESAQFQAVKAQESSKTDKKDGKNNNQSRKDNIKGIVTDKARQEKKEMKKDKYGSKKKDHAVNNGDNNTKKHGKGKNKGAKEAKNTVLDVKNTLGQDNEHKEVKANGTSVAGAFEANKKHGVGANTDFAHKNDNTDHKGNKKPFDKHRNHTERRFERQEERQTDRQNERQIDRQTDRQNDSRNGKHNQQNANNKAHNSNFRHKKDKQANVVSNKNNAQTHNAKNVNLGENVRNNVNNNTQTPKINDKKKNSHRGETENDAKNNAKNINSNRSNAHKSKGTEVIGADASFGVRKSKGGAGLDNYAGAEHVKLTANYIPDIDAEKKALHEKYANALPLAKQIELDEQKRKGIRTKEQIEAKNQYMYQDIEALRKEKPENLVEIVGVRFREAGKIYYFDPDGMDLPFGTAVIVETARGNEYGVILIENRFVPTASIVPPLKKIQRVATPQDTERHNANKEQEREAEKIFNEKVSVHKLEMNLIHVEYTFDNSKLLFYFSAEGRVDFRELVKDLATVFRTRIELRQIGVRDEAKMLGGFGVCGRPVCCSTFLGDFAQVSIKMAKDQSISLNSSKISGTCGRLMCCLRYENEVYESEGAKTPKTGAIVNTPDGKGTVVERNALAGTVKVSLDSDPSVHPKTFMRDEVTVMGYSKEVQEQEDEELKAMEKLD